LDVGLGIGLGYKLNLKKLKRWGLWIGIHGFGLKIGWGSNL
jgi:hypothetical protein